MLLRALAAGRSAGFMSVSMRPPWITTAVIPRGPRSRARPRVRPVSADLAMEYRVIPGSGTRSARALPTVMMRPPSVMCRAAAWAATNTARTSTAHSRSAWSTVISSSGPPSKMPALLTRMSIWPSCWTVCSTAAVTAPGSALSAWMTSTRPLSASICLATAWALPVAVTYVKATAAPLRASRRAIAAPIPRLPPVTSATLPASSSMSGSSRLVGQDHHACGEGLGGDQRQWRLVAVAELRQPGTGQDRVDREPELIDQPGLQQRLRQPAVAEQGQVPAVLLLELGHLGHGVAPDDRGVAPVGTGERRGEHVLADSVDPLGEVIGLAGPGRGEELVAAAAH